jgi:hypothetical protein
MVKETVSAIQEYFGATQIGQAAIREINEQTDTKRRVKIAELTSIETEFQTAFSRDGEQKKAEAAFRDAEAKLYAVGMRLIEIKQHRQSLSNSAGSKIDKLRRELDELALECIAKRYRDWETELDQLRQRQPVIKFGQEVSLVDRKPVDCFSNLPFIKRRIEALNQARQALATLPWQYATEAETVRAMDRLYADLPTIEDQFVAVGMTGEPLKAIA